MYIFYKEAAYKATSWQILHDYFTLQNKNNAYMQ